MKARPQPIDIAGARPDELRKLEEAIAAAGSEREHAEALFGLADYLYRENLDRFREVLDALAQVVERLNDDELRARVLWMRGLYERDRAVGDHGAAAFREAYDVAHRNGNHDGAAQALLHLSRIYDRGGDLPTALATLERCIGMADRLSAHTRAQVFARVAANYDQLADYGSAHAFAVKAIEAAEESGVDQDKVNAYTVAGAVYRSMGMLPRARELMERSLEWIDDVTGGMVQLNNLSAIAAAEEDFPAALAYSNKGLARARARKAVHLVAQLLGNRAEILRRMGRLRGAIRDARGALAMCERQGERSSMGAMVATLGLALIASGETEAGHEHLRSAFELFDAMGRRRSACMLHRELAAIHRAEGRTDLALDHLERYTAMRDELFHPTALDAMADVLHALERRRAEQEREILRLRAAELEQEMEYRNGQLAALALQLVEKREFLATLDARLRSGGDAPAAGLRTRFEELAHDIRRNLDAEAEWETFEDQFSRVHGPFLTSLESRCPALSPTELKVCALTRINLDTKEIARLLSTSVRTVQNHRYNIRRKIGLADRESLASALAQIARQ